MQVGKIQFWEGRRVFFNEEMRQEISLSSNGLCWVGSSLSQ